MSSVEGLAPAVAGIHIEGPGPQLVEPTLPQAEVVKPAAPPSSGLFDPAPYVVDAQRADRLTISFSGTLVFEADDPQGQALFQRLELGRDVELRAAGLVVAKSGRYKRTEDDELITGGATLKIESLYLPSPEELS